MFEYPSTVLYYKRHKENPVLKCPLMGHVVNYINLYIHQGFSNNTVLDALNILPERSVKFDVYLQNFQIKNSN